MAAPPLAINRLSLELREGLERLVIEDTLPREYLEFVLAKKEVTNMEAIVAADFAEFNRAVDTRKMDQKERGAWANIKSPITSRAEFVDSTRLYKVYYCLNYKGQVPKRLKNSIDDALLLPFLVKHLESEAVRYLTAAHLNTPRFWRENPSFASEFKNAPVHVRSNRVVSRAVLSLAGGQLQYCSKEIKNHAALVRIAVGQNCAAIKYAGPNVRGNVAAALRMILLDIETLRVLSDVLYANEEAARFTATAKQEYLSFFRGDVERAIRASCGLDPRPSTPNPDRAAADGADVPGSPDDDNDGADAQGRRVLARR